MGSTNSVPLDNTNNSANNRQPLSDYNRPDDTPPRTQHPSINRASQESPPSLRSPKTSRLINHIFAEKQTVISILEHWVNSETDPEQRASQDNIATRILQAGAYLTQTGFLKIDGNLNLSDSDVIELPDCLREITGDLILSGCQRLIALSPQLKIGRDLNLSGCKKLVELPDPLIIKGSLILNHCTGLIELPKQVTVGGSLHCRNCPQLTLLPVYLSAGWSIDLSGCTGLTKVKLDVQLGMFLDLSNCPQLRDLQFSIEMRCLVLLIKENQLTDVPEGIEHIQYLNTLDLSDNRIQTLPDRLGALAEGTKLILENNPLPAEEIARFQAAYPHIQLSVDQDQPDLGRMLKYERCLLQGV